MKDTNSLSVLSHIDDPSNRKIEDLPGWVPYFSARLETETFDNGSDPCRYCASYINFKLTEASEIVFHPEGGRQLDELPASEIRDWPMTLENLKTGRRREESYGVRTQEGGEQEKDQGSSDCSGYAEKSSEELEGPPETESMSNLGHHLEILEEDINDQKDHFFGGSSSLLPA
ncbi:uncharacterized protein QC763_0034770 [Podospora pseudopauciseta]|uniref:Uncharacterized protein n=1 Tax=Podospora pseudopauciseta TaxID=2093780 RepID=A0ABR0HP87_9PEZI|nr:hypothetical protein QC763_0034770 [Podospora pseudopauciseta]